MLEAGFHFEILPSNAEEMHDPQLSPAQLTESNALIKAAPIAETHRDAVVIGADTLVYLDGEPLGKPVDMAQAEAMLCRLVGKTHQVCTGVALLRYGDLITFHVITEVTFKVLTIAEIRAYLALIDPLDKAGAYAAQDLGEIIIERTAGSFTNVIGLPMNELTQHLSKHYDIVPTKR